MPSPIVTGQMLVGKLSTRAFQRAFDPLGTPAGSIFPERLKLPLASEEVGGIENFVEILHTVSFQY